MPSKTRLDVHQIQSVNIGLYRTAFDKIVDLAGFQIQPTDQSGWVWEFQRPDSGGPGRLLHVEGFLSGGGVTISVEGTAYMITRQHFTLALAFPSAPRNMWLSDSNHKVLPKDDELSLPAGWPRELVAKVIRSRFRKVVIIDESFLLQKIGLRTPLSLR
jgi:hypothetical protein